MKNKNLLFYFLILGCLSLVTNRAQANDYLEHQKHYTVQSMGNGVLRFTIPIWVYGSWNDYCLDGNLDRKNDKDTYIWYSTSPDAKRGGSSVHRIASVAARHYGKNDNDGSEGQGFFYLHEGSAIIQSTYNGEKITLQADDDTYWRDWANPMSLKRKKDDDHERITYITFDWYPPTELQGKEFYWGVSAAIYKKQNSVPDYSYLHWWAWPEKYTGGDIPQSPELFEPYIYAMDATGSTGYGCAAVQYSVYQEPISYHTSLDSKEVYSTKRSSTLIIPTKDTVQRFFSATFYVYTDKDAGQKQYLKSNEIHIPAYHRPYDLKAKELLDEKGSVTGEVKLTWEVKYPNAKDLVEGDVFEVQRATQEDFSDAQTIDVLPIIPDSTYYISNDNPLQALGADTSTRTMTVTRQVVTKNLIGDPYALDRATLTSKNIRVGQEVYYRVRRASASVWGWNHDFALSTKTLRADFLAPLAAKQPEYTKDADYDNNRKVHFQFKLDNQVIVPTLEDEKDCEFSCVREQKIDETLPIRIKLDVQDVPNFAWDDYEYIFYYRLPESSTTNSVKLTTLKESGKYVQGEFPANTVDLRFDVKYKGTVVGSNTPAKGLPYVKTVIIRHSANNVSFDYDASYYRQVLDSISKENSLNADSIKHELYEELKAQIQEMTQGNTAHCNWDKSALLYLRRVAVETGDVLETVIPSDSIVRLSDGSWVAHITDVADQPCVHYQYSVRLDDSHSLLKALNPNSLNPIALSGPDLYFNSVAHITNLQASQGDDRYGVLLSWKPEGGGVDSYEIGRRPKGSSEDFKPLTKTEETDYRDLTAEPGAEYEYRVTAVYTCKGQTTSNHATVVGSRSPYGKISGRLHYEDGTGCAGITVELQAGENHWSTVTDEAGSYVFDTLRYYPSTQFIITPTHQKDEFRYNNTEATTASITLSADYPVAEAIEFDNISSVRFSGRVLYKNSSIPVRDAYLLLSGNIVKQAGGPVKTDVSGNFEIRVPKGRFFTLQAAKDGHTFEGDGFVRMNDSEQLKLEGPQDGVRIWDNTKVRLAGRVTGGMNQAAKPLGFGLSTNNLGDNLQLVLELEGDNVSYIVRLPDDLTKDTLEYTVSHEVYPTDGGGEAKVTGFTDVHYQRKRIIINPDPLTGEFCADLFPVRYKITQATATGYATLFAKGKTSETIDLSDAAHHQDSTVYEKHVARWNERFNITYRSPIHISCQQMRYGMLEDFYGEKAVTRQNILNQNISIPLAERDSSGTYHYVFGAPVFATGEYRFRVTAHEDYYYNNIEGSEKHEEVRIKGGTLKVYNGMHDAFNTQTQVLPLNTEGQADITVPIDYVSFLKTGESALRVLDLSIESDGQFVEYQALKAYVMGNRIKGNDYLVSMDAKVTLLDVLRDPPGSKSYAYIESGTTYTYDYTYKFEGTFGLEIGARYGTGNTINLGTWSGVGGGLYTGYTMSHSFQNSYALPITSSVFYSNAGSYSFTTNQRIETGSDAYHVGSVGDVYIGTTQSVFFGLLDAVRPIDSVTFASIAAQMIDTVGMTGTADVVAQGYDAEGHPYYLVIGEETQAGTYVDGSFAYTQDFILNSLLPRLIRERDALLLTGDSMTVQAICDAQNKVVYWSKVAPDEATYALTDYTKLYPKGKSTDWIDIDDVAKYNKQISNWMGLIRDNEKEKIGVIYGVNADLIGNYSLSDGLKESYSEKYSYSSTTSYRWDYPTLSPKTSLNLLGSSIASQMTQANTEVLRKLFSIVNLWEDDGAGGHDGKDPYFIDVNMPEAEWKFSITPILNFDFNRDPKKSTAKNKSAGFVLQTDEYSYMNVTVARMREENNWFNQDSYKTREYVDNGNDYNGTDYLYGSYVYMLNGGASKCPWEQPEESAFYEQGGQPVLLSKGTLALENPKLDINVHERSDVPHDKPAIFNLRMTNEIEQNLGIGPIDFMLKLDEESNAKGAKVLVDGMPLTGSGRLIRLTSGQIINKTMEVYAGEDYDYEDIVVILGSTCYLPSSSKATFSVHYMPVSCDVNIASPHDKWVMNTLSPKDSIGYYLPVVIDGFDVNYKGFDHIEMQYKLSKQSDDGWVNMCSYYADDSLYNAASGTKAMISGGRISNIRFYGERDPIEQQYDLRAVSFCRHGNSFLTRASAVLTGIKDTRPPVLFGAPQPANGILGIGDDIKLRFSEPIAGNYLDEDNNFQLIGATNRTGITASTSPHFTSMDKSYAYTKVERTLADRFTIDLLIKPDQPNTDEAFFCHGDKGKGILIGKTADNQLLVQIGNSMPIYSKPLDEPIASFTRIVVTYDSGQGIRFYAGTKDFTQDSENGNNIANYNITAPLIFGSGFLGNMLEARVWSKALTAAEIANTHMHYLTGYERELVAYYRMNEGRGNTIKDYAHGATLYMEGADWSMQNGISLRVNPDEPVELDNRYLNRSEIQDETILFWFRTTDTEGNLFSAGRSESGKEAIGFALKLADGKIVLCDGAEERISDIPVNDGSWHHLILSVNRTYNNVSVYIDDKMTDTFSADNFGAISGKMFIGGFDGHIDEFAIFEQALPKALIEDYDNITPYGDEMGLMAFLPFEKLQENENGILESVFSPNDQRQFTDNENNVINKVVPLILSPEAAVNADNTNHAPVRSRGLLTKMNFTWTFDNTELLISLKMADREVNKQSMYITVRDVEDLNGNPMVSPVTWTAFMDRNSLKWSTKQVTYWSEYDRNINESNTTVKIINTSGKRHTYQIESSPVWLTVDKPNGAVDPEGEVTLRLSFNREMPVGVYTDFIYLTDEDGLSEPLQIEYTVEAYPPYDNVNETKYPLNMSICGKVMLATAGGSVYDTDERDIIYAVYHNECIGKANIKNNNMALTSDIYLTVFGNDDMVRKPLYFQLWQASTGKLYNLTPDRKIQFAHGYVYGCGDESPVIFTTTGSETQSIDLAPGWNWMSTNLYLYPDSIALLNKVMSAAKPWSEGDLIKNPANRQFSTYNAEEDAFIGSLVGWDYQQIYMVHSANSNTMRFMGNELPSSKMTLTLRGNGQWNAFPCLFNEATDVTEAMSDYFDDATPGDILKAHNRFAVFSPDKQWVGDLTAIRPGEGYLMRRVAPGSVTIRFYHKNANVPKKANSKERMDDSPWTNPQASTNMTMIAAINSEAINSEAINSEAINVYIGNELVGVATPVTRNPSPVTEGGALYFLTIQSDVAGPLRFETEDGTVLTPIVTINYVPDTHHGSLKAPVLLSPVTGNPSSVTAPYKVIENDHVVIIRNGVRYDITGKRLEQ